MKSKIIIFLIGLLLGAIISTGSIYAYTVANSTTNNGNMQMPNDNQNGGSNPPSMPNNNDNSNMKTSE